MQQAAEAAKTAAGRDTPSLERLKNAEALEIQTAAADALASALSRIAEAMERAAAAEERIARARERASLHAVGERQAPTAQRKTPGRAEIGRGDLKTRGRH